MRKLTILWLLASSVAINVYAQTVSLDNTFGQNGKTIIPNTSEISFFDFDNHGNIVAVGYTLKGGGKYDLTITKTNTDGIIVENFGNGGVAKVTDYDNSSPLGFKITNDNKIIVIGSFTKIQFQGRETLIMQFNEDGSINENFGENGKVNLNFNTGDLISLNCETEDFILIGRSVGETIEINGNLYYTLTGYSVSKYNHNGELDESFGENGKVLLKTTETFAIAPNCMKILNDGSIFIAGFGQTLENPAGNKELAFCKLTPNGELDKDFANGGIWRMDIMMDFHFDYESFSNVLEDNNGNLILSGWGLTNKLGWSNRAFLSKFFFNGILDTSFGENGFYCFDFGGNYNPVFQIGDKYVTAGWYNNETHKIIYVNDNGSFGDYVYTSGIYYFQDMKLQGRWNKMILGGGYRINDTYSANFSLERVDFDLETSIKSNNYNSSNIIIFPNPTKENLYFSNETMFEVMNIQGKVLLKSESPVKYVNIGNLRTGIYFVRFGNSVQKFVKE
jgi:uncharacterized delta-60 repeat protein